MTIYGDMATALGTIFACDMAASMTYTQGTSTATVNALRQSIEAYSKQIDPMIADHSTFYLQQSDLGAIVPDLYDTLSDGTNTWRVESIRHNPAGVYILLCSKNQRVKG